MPWSTRVLISAVSFLGKIWVFGGLSSTNNCFNEIWSTSDGITLNRADRVPAWSARACAQLAVFKGRIWMVGGFQPGGPGSGAGLLSDIWTSADGLNWDAAKNPPMAAVGRADVAVLNEVMYWIGLTAGSHNAVWWTSDGVTWTPPAQ